MEMAQRKTKHANGARHAILENYQMTSFISHTTTSTSYPQYPLASPKGRLADYVRGFSMSAWFLLMLAGFWWQKDWHSSLDLDVRSNFFKFSIAGIVIAAFFHLSLGMKKLLKCPYLFPSSDVKSTLLMGFCVLMLVFSPLSLQPLRSAQYALVTWAALCVCYWAWEGSYVTFRRVLLITGFLTLAFLSLLLLRYGISRGSVGGINRNRFATSAFVAVVFCFLAKGRFKWLGILLGIGLILAVNSRGTLVSLGLFFGAYILFTKGFQKAAIAGAVMTIAVVLLVVMPSSGKSGENLIMDKIMKVNDKARGSGSGLSGRVERWENGLKTFWLRPLTGYGFRTRSNETTESRSAHSGYINLMLDSGILGTAFVILAFASDFFRRVFLINQWKRDFRRSPMPESISDSIHLNGIVCSMYVMMGALWVIEPLYFNLGATLTVMFFLLVSSPITMPGPAMIYPRAAYAAQRY